MVIPSLILADNNTTISYLKGQNQNAWISQALTAASVEEVDISYLDYQTTDLMTAAKNILVLAAVKSPETVKINQLVEVIVTSKNNGQFGSVDLLNDDFWAILALASVKHLDNTQDVKNFILEHQNSDGGWSWAKNGASDSNDTAAAIMALLDWGLTSSSTEITRALGYLKSVQNDDGGFAYDIGSLSDGASTAWIMASLNKAEISASSWQKNNNNPVAFLENLRQDDGSFLWMPSDDHGSSMVTAYALLALSGQSYPVNYIDIGTEDEEPISGHSLRIEGPEGTICLASGLQAQTVLDLLELGAEVCDFEYVLQDSSYGTYVSAIGGLSGQGMNGWQYFVDWQPAMVAAPDYILEGHQGVLWAYGGWPFYPVRVEINNTRFQTGDTLLASFNYYDGEKWLPLASQAVIFGSDTYQTDNLGKFIFTLNTDGIWPLFSQQSDQYVRSNREYIIVGSGVSKVVDLSVKIESGSGGIGDDTIAFSIDKSSIDFGTLKPGQAADTIVSLVNTGNVDIHIEASVLGDQLFQNFTSLDQNLWEDYNIALSSSASRPVNVGLSVPTTFNTPGQKAGQLIFWATSQ